ncbi:hypothetical protein PR003_g23830 [Phytophthora rubi]|uniref:Uncharacterized protein n=1 Tax=Phytophthora rubi TaxID=129364 RepID=A0A6A4D3H8_9STRA|nr:hypothetical protein PR002_g22197 [Phytophthora rubi]KAE8997874.1 hypothetical protein PR001_g19472 [Phytophthora rubi]KAE9296142.1 hypothetical protein PR003_g23830 [Phytophthora rubi]
MHCTSRNAADTAVFTEIPPRGAQRDAFVAAILAQNMKKHAAGSKRSCPFATPAATQRQRRDDDLSALQNDVAELEARLAAARRRRQPAAPKRQLDPSRLRAMLQACHKQAQQEADITNAFTLGMQSVDRLEFEPSVDASVFEEMKKRVGDQYDQLGDVFRDAGLHESKTDFYDARVVTGAKQGTFVRFTTAKAAPFDVNTINTAMWAGAKKNAALNVSSAVESDDDEVLYLKKQCVLQQDAGGGGISVLLRGVCRRFVEPHRIVVVWEGTGDWPKDYLRNNPSSVPIREHGYCVIQKLQSKSGRAAPLSLYQTCVCMTPGLSAGIDMDQPECLQMLSDVVIPSYRKILDAREQMLENAILDEMIHSKMRSSSTFRV